MGSLAQENDADTLQEEYVPKIKLNFYVDYGKLLTLASNFERKYEGGLEIMLADKFPLILEIGNGEIFPQSAFRNGTYNSDGTYYRLGAGYTPRVSPKNRLGITFRYGRSLFDEDIRLVVSSPSQSQDDFVQVIERESLTAQWAEAILYSDTKLNRWFTVGLNLRLRILLTYDQIQRLDENDTIDVYAIPGYGRSFDDVIPAANLFLKITL
ncbi:MAG: DUF6048 family protein [Bacteroidota bacterium]